LHVEVSILVKAPLDKTYAAYTDFESWPKWSAQANSVKVVSREGNTVRIVSESGPPTRVRISTTNLVLTPQEKVESTSVKRLTETRRTVTFKSTSEGTEVTAVLDVEVNGIWRVIFKPSGREEAEMTARKGLKSFADYAENLP